MSKELYRNKQLQEMFAWEEGLPMDIVSISEADKLSGSPKQGDMIAVNPKDGSDMWLVAKQFFEDNYEAALQAEPVEQEPVAWVTTTSPSDDFNEPDVYFETDKPKSGNCIPLYTHPATNEVSGYPKPFERLSAKEILELIPPYDNWKYEVGYDEATSFANAIMDKIAEKNK